MRKPIKFVAFSAIVPVGKDYPIDQYPVQEFNLNECGVPRNDIDAFELAQNDTVKQTILRRLEKIGKPNFDGRSTEEIMETIIPNGCQSPAEVARYSSRLVRHYKDKLDASAAVKAQQAEKAAAAAAARQKAEQEAFDRRFKESMIKFNEKNSK